MATKQKKKAPPLRGGTNPAPTMDQWTEEARKIADAKAADGPAKGSQNIPDPSANSVPADGAQKTDQNIHENMHDGPKPIGKDIEQVINRVKELPGHVNDGDWRGQRKSELKDIAERRNEKVGEMNQLKAEYASAKKAVEGLDAELLSAVRDLDKPYPPKPAKLYPDPDEKKSKKREPSKNGTVPPTDDESWRSVPLASLSLPKGILEKLANPVHKHRGAVPPIKTIGDITDFLKPKDGWEPRLVDITGIGKTAVDKIDAALETFWKERSKVAPAKETKPVDKPSEPTEAKKDGEKPAENA